MKQLQNLLLKKFMTYYLFIPFLLLDIISKFIACKYSILYCTLNTGSAWSLFSQFEFYSLMIGILGMIFILFLFLFRTSFIPLLSNIGFHLCVAGIIGNTINRIFFNGVIDIFYIPFLPFFGIFNVADIYLNIVILIVIYLEFFKKKKTSNSNK